MPTLLSSMTCVLAPLAPLFSERVRWHARLLLVGAIFAPGRRTVGSLLRVIGLDREKRFRRYHRVLSRANRSSLGASRVLLGLPIRSFCLDGPLVLGIDETLERRKGASQGAALPKPPTPHLLAGQGLGLGILSDGLARALLVHDGRV